MDKNELFLISDQMKSMLGEEQLLEALMRAMSSDELESHLRYIDRMYETHQF